MQRKFVPYFHLFLTLYIMAAPALFISISPISASPSVPQVPSLGTTYINKPVSPIKIDRNQIPVGYARNYVYNLKANHTYHVYCYGGWIKNNLPLTDYDIFVFDPFGNLVSYHTEAAGMYEHLGDDVEQPFFIPKYSGDYRYYIINDPKESNAADNATLMVIENIKCNRWYQRFIEGKVNDAPVENTTWAYEFNTTSKHIEVWVKVPETLDMYEARLYPMANPSKKVSVLLNGVPLAWEPGLYGARSGIYGGYNLDSRGWRNPDTTASCEYPGEDMLINYTSPEDGNILYHLALIGESGTGTVEFMVKTDFESPKVDIINPIENANTNEEVNITAQVSDDQSGIEEVLLSYTNDDWATENSTLMSLLQDETYVGTVPGQSAGKTIKYKVSARDYAGNYGEDQGSYIVKNPTAIVFSLSSSKIHGGESITVMGSISHGGTLITLKYTCGNTIIVRTTTALPNGSFSDAFTPTVAGLWTVMASWNGNATCFGASSEQTFTVEKITLTITYTLSSDVMTIGDSVTIHGSVTPLVQNIQVLVTFTFGEFNYVRQAFTQADGTFTLSFQPDSIGSWQVTAKIQGDNLRYNPASGDLKYFKVNDTWISQNKIFLIIGAGFSAIGAFILLIIIKARWRKLPRKKD